MYRQAVPRRPWRGSVTCCWFPDRMVAPAGRSRAERRKGNDRPIERQARTKQRRLDRYLASPDTPEWEA